MERGNRSFLGLRGASRSWILDLLDRAEAFLPIVQGDEPPKPATRSAIIAMLFLEASTRTRCSFEVAAQRLGHTTVLLGSSGTSITKGESILDTARTIDALGVDAIVVRSALAGGAAGMANVVKCPLINAGDGRNEHPTQALLDALALRGHLGDLEGRTILIVGDIVNSRVARSNIWCLSALGAKIILCGPAPLVPESMASLAPEAISISDDLDRSLPHADAVMMLRVQRERGGGASIGEDYASAFGLTLARANRLNTAVPVLHPGPANKGVEIAAAVHEDAARSLVLRQVACGVAVRMAVLARAVT